MVKGNRIRRDVRSFALPSISKIEKATNANRTAPWMIDCQYESLRWTVSDTDNPKNTRVIDFEYVMPGGKTLADFPKFLRAAREYAYWIRNQRYTRINDAETHAAVAQYMMLIIHGLAVDGLTSFKNVSKKFLKVFVRRMKFAGDGVLRASERIESWLKQHQHCNPQQLRALLPLESNGHYWRLKATEFLRSIGLPISAARYPRAAHFMTMIRNRAELTQQPESLPPAPPELAVPNVMTLTRMLGTFEALFNMRNVIDAIGIYERPFDFSTTTFARKHGARSIPTPLPPPQLALHLMSHAMTWVLNYSDALLELFDQATSAAPELAKLPTGQRQDRHRELVKRSPQTGPEHGPWPLCVNSVYGVNGLSMHTALSMLFIACMIVIATFSARRLEELTGLETGDFRRDKSGKPWLRAYIQKTLQGKEWLPTADIVGRAFAVLCRLSTISRRENGDKFITRWTTPFISGGSTIIRNWSKANINQFANFVGTPKVVGLNGELEDWAWNSHQFRRFFAVLYFYRYRGSIDDLAYFLRHLDLEMTRKYLTVTPDQAKAFREVEGQYHRTVGQDILAGKSDKVGAGRELKRQMHLHFQKKLRVSPPSDDESLDFLTRQMRTRRWVFRPRRWGDCTCPSSKQGSKAARCRANRTTQGLGPDFANSAPSICAECPFIADNGHLEEQRHMEELGYQELSDNDLLKGTLVAGMARAKVISLMRVEGDVR
ncbi:hypothetical protein MW290_22005 [Aquincola tertiaricarbonis]|uniref:Phage integrase family protein n=1 Tax=Aquincola tertiaricarbonis TaxID=391953 RepID=A0ABY4SJT6_AQUTE|nr:hypothetical protein [Aquincola tertiaricarbonis]URI11615.1 hypothetical protein MW290_22005 [Aquincola tertiaricarbonis]